MVTTLYVLSPSSYTATKRKLSSLTKQLFYLLMFMDTFLTAGQLHEHLSCYLTSLLTTTPNTSFTPCQLHGHFTSNLLTKQALHPRGNCTYMSLSTCQVYRHFTSYGKLYRYFTCYLASTKTGQPVVFFGPVIRKFNTLSS
jgi:hypothetical protein